MKSLNGFGECRLEALFQILGLLCWGMSGCYPKMSMVRGVEILRVLINRVVEIQDEDRESRLWPRTR